MDFQQITKDRWGLVRFDDDEIDPEHAAAFPHLSDAEVVAVKVVLLTALTTFLDGDDLDRRVAAVRDKAKSALAKISAMLRIQLPSPE